RMANMAKENRIQLRPHIKTHKLPYVAKKQLAGGEIGITVATISEAEVMAEAGIEDIFIAYPIVSESKAKKLIQLKQKISNLIVGVDSLVGANVLEKVAKESNDTLQVRLEVDTGLARTCVKPHDSVVFVKLIVLLVHLVL